jgi:hypothetical protein
MTIMPWLQESLHRGAKSRGNPRQAQKRIAAVGSGSYEKTLPGFLPEPRLKARPKIKANAWGQCPSLLPLMKAKSGAELKTSMVGVI